MQHSDIQFIAIGPGSQPDPEDGGQLNYLPMPSQMASYEPAPLPERDEVVGMEAGLSVLRDLEAVLARYRVGEPAVRVGLGDLDSANRRFLHQVLGDGEVSVISVDAARLRVQETRLAGLWWVHVRHDDVPGQDFLEVAEIPALVRSQAFSGIAPARAPASAPDGVMNAPPVLVELFDRAAAWRSHADTHVVNLSLLPLTEPDLAWIDESLGQGGVVILSRGYGNCRISATALRNVWWVQHFNNDEKLILNTLVVDDVPVEALAAQEDIDDSAVRIAEILEALQ